MKDKIKVSFDALDAINNKVSDFESEHKDYKVPLPGVPLPKFKICFTDSIYTWSYTYSLETKYLFVRVTNKVNQRYAAFTTDVLPLSWNGLYIPPITWDVNSNPSIKKIMLEKVSDEGIPYRYVGSDEDKVCLNERWLYVLFAFTFIQKSLLILPSVYRKETSEKISKPSKTSKSSKKHDVKLQNVYTLKSVEDIKEIKPLKIRQIKFKCECWGVRGHIRHLKNGKEVFIKAYTKGTKRNDKSSFVNKTYVY